MDNNQMRSQGDKRVRKSFKFKEPTQVLMGTKHQGNKHTVSNFKMEPKQALREQSKGTSFKDKQNDHHHFIS